MFTTDLFKSPGDRAVLDEPKIGDIGGALGTVRACDIAPPPGWWVRLRTLVAILWPGLIVMVSDNDAGAFGTLYPSRARLWDQPALDAAAVGSRSLREPEVVLRLGAVTGVGYAPLILERCGKFWLCLCPSPTRLGMRSRCIIRSIASPRRPRRSTQPRPIAGRT